MSSSSLPSKKKLFVRRNRCRRSQQRGDDNDKEDNDNTTEYKYEMQETQCQECNSTSNKVSYRPLVNANGSYLCDTCYKTKFPATAMCDMTDNQNIILSKFHERDIRKKQNFIKKKEEGDSNISNGKSKYTEEEECCSCLEKGIYHQCCKK